MVRRQFLSFEWLYSRTRLPVDRSPKIASNAKNPRPLWERFDTLLGRRRADQPPKCTLSTMNAAIDVKLRLIIAIHISSPKTCELHPLPTFLLQKFVDGLRSFLTILCDWSIKDGVLSPSQKRTILVPVVKRSGLDSYAPIYTRPIAYVFFISKIIEKDCTVLYCIYICV